MAFGTATRVQVIISKLVYQEIDSLRFLLYTNIIDIYMMTDLDLNN